MAELQCDVFIIDSSGFNNTSQLGGAVYVTDGCLMYVERCQINGCKVSSLERLNASGGAFAVTDSSKLIIKDCEFYNNTALFSGGVAFLSIQSYAYINNTQFSFNLALRGGGIDFNGPINATIMNCIFSHNSGTNNGGAINLITGSGLILKQTTFINNNDGLGGPISTGVNATAVIEECTFIGNRGFVGGALYLSNSDRVAVVNTLITETVSSIAAVYIGGTYVLFAKNVTITRNYGNVQLSQGTALYLSGNITFESNIARSPKNEVDIYVLKLNEGGALTVYRATVFVRGKTYFNYNTAENGAAIHATNADITVSENAIIANNTARYNGGGIYLYQSRLQCNDVCILSIS